MPVLINIVLPIFGIILAGYLCGRSKLLGAESTAGLNQYVYWVALPALLFGAMAEVDLDLIFDADFFGAYVGGQLIVMIIAMGVGVLFYKNTLEMSGINGMNSIYGNTGFLGIPLAFAAFGEAATVPTIITVVVNSALVVAAAIIVVELAQNREVQKSKVIYDVFKALCKNPMLISPALGLLWACLDEPLPEAVLRFCELLGSSAGPCALFAIGLFLVGKPVSDGISEVTAIVLLKLIVHPAITWFLAIWIFELPPLWAAVAVLMAATPTGAGCFVLAQQYQIHVHRTSTIILFSTLFSVLSIFLLLQYYSSLLIQQ